jgi:hypothetical protein
MAARKPAAQAEPDEPETSEPAAGAAPVDPAEQAKADAEAADSEVAAQVQAVVDAETEQGFRGIEVDPTPNENYTLAGQAAGAPTPETDAGAAEVARAAHRDTAAAAAGVAGK